MIEVTDHFRRGEISVLNKRLNSLVVFLQREDSMGVSFSGGQRLAFTRLKALVQRAKGDDRMAYGRLGVGSLENEAAPEGRVKIARQFNGGPINEKVEASSFLLVPNKAGG